MKSIQLLLSALLFTGTLGLSAQPLWAQVSAQGILSAVVLPGSNYCHMKFPAIREETLGWDHPILKDADSGDIIDFYGPCNHDPLGKDEIHTQIDQQRYRRDAFKD